VKLFLRYQNQKAKDPWAMATGWLIKDNIMVTAGHCAFDWTHKMGRVTQVKAYIGYNGKKSTGDRTVQFRKGKRVVTTSEWLTQPDRAHDVSLIQLDEPFTDIKPIQYADTPMSDKTMLGVVGYPGDLKNDSGEPGAEMYKMFLNVDYNLSRSKDRMLEYPIDTYGG
jgi:V8-like Glu-specific endopeptidase